MLKTSVVLRGNRCAAQVFKVKYSSASASITSEISDQHANVQPFEKIPGPRSLPLLGNALDFAPKFGRFSKITFTEMIEQLHEEYGNILKLDIPGKKKMVFMYDPDDVEKVFRNEGPWPIRNGNESLNYYREVTRKDLFQGVTGLVVSQGEKWQTFRSKVNQPMLQPKTAKLYIGPIDEVAGDFIKRVETIKDDKKEMPDDFLNELQKWSLESVALIGLDTRLGCLQGNLKPDSEPQRMIDAIHVVFESFEKLDLRIPFWKVISTPTWRKYVKNLDFFNDVAMKYINKALAEMKENKDREPSLLQRILARDPEKTTALLMALDMITAGIDTTSYTVANTLCLLAKYQDKQQKLYEEIESLISSYGNDCLNSDHINNARYLKASVKESLRMLPVAPGNIREAPVDFVLSNYRVPKGVDLLICTAAMCRKEKYFPQADKFIPERWLKDQSDDTKSLHPFVYLPFGFGTRMCIGRRLAELEIEVILMRLVQKYKVEYHYGEMEYKALPLLRPALPLKLKLVDRN